MESMKIAKIAVIAFVLVAMFAGCLYAEQSCTYGNSCSGTCSACGSFCSNDNCACVNSKCMPLSAPFCMSPTNQYFDYANGRCVDNSIGGSVYFTSGLFSGSSIAYQPGFHIWAATGSLQPAISTDQRKKLPLSTPVCSQMEAAQACDNLPKYVQMTTSGLRVFVPAPYCACVGFSWSGVCKLGTPGIEYGSQLPDQSVIRQNSMFCGGEFDGCRWRSYNPYGSYITDGGISVEGYQKCSVYDFYPNLCNAQSQCHWSGSGGGSCHPQVNTPADLCTYNSTNQRGNCCTDQVSNPFCVLDAPPGEDARCKSCITTGTPPAIGMSGGNVSPTRCVSSGDCCSNGICDSGASSSTYHRCVTCLPLNGAFCGPSSPCCSGLTCNSNNTCVQAVNHPPNTPLAILAPNSLNSNGTTRCPQVNASSNHYCQSMGDPDPGDTVTITYRWRQNNQELGLGDNTFDCHLHNCQSGDQIRVQVVATDNHGNSSVSAWSSPATVFDNIPITCNAGPGQPCDPEGDCCKTNPIGLICSIVSPALNGHCCIQSGNTNWQCTGSYTNNSQCCSKYCGLPDDAGRRFCGSGIGCNQTCTTSDECAELTCPICANIPGNSTSVCSKCILTNSTTGCTKNSVCCSGLCNQLNTSSEFHTCVNCLPLNHTCMNNTQCCSGSCQDVGMPIGQEGDFIGGISNKICVPPVPACARLGASCGPNLQCCNITTSDPPVTPTCDYLNPNPSPIKNPVISSEGDSSFTGSTGVCRLCYPDGHKCSGAMPCCSASFTCRSSNGVNYCLGAGDKYLFNNWVMIGSSYFTPEKSNRHSGATALKIEAAGNPGESYIYNSVLVLKSNTEYSLEFWAANDQKHPSTTGVRYALYDVSNNAYLSESGTWNKMDEESDTNPITNTGVVSSEYAHIVRTFKTIDSNVGYVQLRLYPGDTGTVYADDVQVTELHDFTMIAWIKSGEDNSGASILYQLGEEYGNAQGINWFFSNPNTLTMGAYSAAGTNGQPSSIAPQVTLPDGNWHMVALSVVRSGEYAAYLDGKQISQAASRKFTLGRLNTPNDLYIGYGTGKNGFNGQLDEIRFYKRSLSSAEILDHYLGKYQDRCSMDLKVTYYTPISPSNLKATYNADVRLRTMPPETILAMPFDVDISSGTAGSITDYSSSLAHGTKVGATWTADGKVGGAYSFAGSDRISLPTPLITGTRDFTLSAWIKPKGSEGTIMGNLDKLNANGVKLYLNAGSPSIAIGSITISAKSSVAGSWKHVAATRKNGVVTLYINGVEAGSGKAPGSITGSSSFAIGSGFAGTIDEVRAYSKAMSETEIVSLYKDSGLLVDKQLITSEG